MLDDATNKWGVKVNRIEHRTSIPTGYRGGNGKADES